MEGRKDGRKRRLSVCVWQGMWNDSSRARPPSLPPSFMELTSSSSLFNSAQPAGYSEKYEEYYTR